MKRLGASASKDMRVISLFIERSKPAHAVICGICWKSLHRSQSARILVAVGVAGIKWTIMVEYYQAISMNLQANLKLDLRPEP
jgi:hypothetical protein